jgi:PadR family transcriptional regulator PadR
MKMRMSAQTLLVLDALVEGAGEWVYGYGISRATGLKSGTLYPILMRLAERGLWETSWEVGEGGRPPRHLYRLTGEGVGVVREMRAERAEGTLGRVALSGEGL